MIVVDASALLAVLLDSADGANFQDRILSPQSSLHAPHLIDLEVAHVFRRFAALGTMKAQQGLVALDTFAALKLNRYPHTLLLPRVWALRHNFTAYDSVYVALAEALDAPLLTLDERLAAAVRQYTKVALI